MMRPSKRSQASGHRKETFRLPNQLKCLTCHLACLRLRSLASLVSSSKIRTEPLRRLRLRRRRLRTPALRLLAYDPPTRERLRRFFLRRLRSLAIIACQFGLLQTAMATSWATWRPPEHCCEIFFIIILRTRVIVIMPGRILIDKLSNLLAYHVIESKQNDTYRYLLVPFLIYLRIVQEARRYIEVIIFCLHPPIRN